jgi:hypothetical protein
MNSNTTDGQLSPDTMLNPHASLNGATLSGRIGLLGASFGAALFGALALAACSGTTGDEKAGGDKDNSSDDAPAWESGDEGDGGSAIGKPAAVSDDDAGPVLITLLSNSDVITPTHPIMLNIVASDPDGIEDVIGGVVRTETGAALTALATSASEGAYSATITWEQFRSIEPANFDKSQAVKVVVEVFDQAGHRVSETVDLTLACSRSKQVGQACDGDCHWAFNGDTTSFKEVDAILDEAGDMGTSVSMVCDGKDPCDAANFESYVSDTQCGACGNACSNGYCAGGECKAYEGGD